MKRPNGEVQEAMKERDDLLAQVQGAVDKVDRLKDELLEEYAEADALRAAQMAARAKRRPRWP